MKKNISCPLFMLLLVTTMPLRSFAAEILCSTVVNSTRINLDKGGPIAASPDQPIGTVLFRGSMHNVTKEKDIATCKAGFGDKGHFYLLGRIKSGSLSGIDNYTYQTNIPGVGVRMAHALLNDVFFTPESVTIPNETDWSNVTLGLTNRTLTSAKARDIVFELVKTGPIKPGLLQGSSMPQFSVALSGYIKGSTTTMPVPLDISALSFSGSLEFTAPTCTTPSKVDVNLGQFSTQEVKEGKGSTWKDASIRLTNCQTFLGTKQTALNYNLSYTSGPSESDISFVWENDPNSLGITLNSNQENIDIANGIVGIKQGPNEAQGVNIQIGRGTTTSNTPAPLTKEFSQVLPLDGTTNITIPLVVRMIRQEGARIKAGQVNAQITYTINYK